MRVDHVVTAFPRQEGDVITPWMVELLRRSRERGVDARVLAPAYRGGRDHHIQGIPVRRFRYAPAPWERLSHEETVPDRIRRSPVQALLVPLYLLAGTAAARSAGRSRPDILHVHWPMPHAIFGAAGRRASGGRTALVCSYYAVEVNWVIRRLRWLRPLLRWSARTADGITAISTSTAATVRRATGREARVIPFAAAVTGEGVEETPPPFSVRGPLRLLFVGRLVERKGVEVLVEALARVREERPAELTVVGEGTWEPRIRRAVRAHGLEDRVRFTGHVTDAALSQLYRECDIFVLPAVVDRKGDTEGLGVVLLEALRYARPVIGSDVGGIPDIVQHERTGWLVPPRDPGALAETILRIAARPEASRRVGLRGREFARTRFSWDRILDDLFACYDRAIRRRRAGESDHHGIPDALEASGDDLGTPGDRGDG